MKQFYCAEDIERLVVQGQERLVVGEDVVLTDLARERARELGLPLVKSGRRSAEARGDLPGRAVGAKPKGCQHGPLPTPPSRQDTTARRDDQVVDELVGLVKQLRDSS